MEDAFRFFDETVKIGFSPTLVTYNALIYGLCRKGRLEEAEGLVPQITSSGFSPDVITYNSLISGYSDAGNTQKCLELYETMKRLGIKPTLKTYHPLIRRCGKEDMELVERWLNEMSQFGLANFNKIQI